MRDARLYLQDILDAVNNIKEYTVDMDFEAFKRDRKTQDAVARNLGVIGEAANRLPESIREKHRDIPWQEIKGMRNILAHEYFGVKLETIWETICSDLPKLLSQIQKAFSDWD